MYASRPTPSTRFLAISSLLVFLAMNVPGRGEINDRWLITFTLPVDPEQRAPLDRAAAWIEKHIVEIHTSDQRPLDVVAWKDPTLHPEKPREWAGYLITDTLWSAYALYALNPPSSRRLWNSLKSLGWTENQLHEVIAQDVPQLLHAPADEDFVHGHSLGIFPTASETTVDVRVFRHQWKPDFDVGHPFLFAEHAVYRALHELHQGQRGPARDRIERIIRRRPEDASPIRWDDDAKVLVDQVNSREWERWKVGQQPEFRHYTFKGALLLYALRQLRLDEQYPSVARHLSERIWSAQNADGGVGHFVDIDRSGSSRPAPDATGEACAISILAEIARPLDSKPSAPSPIKQ